MIIYVTDMHGKTHAYPTSQYVVNSSKVDHGWLVQIRDFTITEGYNVVAEFYHPSCWWKSDPLDKPAKELAK